MCERLAGGYVEGVLGSGSAAGAGFFQGVPHRFDLTAVVGGPARRTVVVLLAAVLGLEAADIGAVGALAAPLEHAFGVGNAMLGLLVTASTLVGAAATLPFGVLTDRHSRTRLLQVVVLGWAIATVVSAGSTSFAMLLVSRLALGGVVAAAGPAVASLVGDLFPADERGRLYGFVLTGQLVGAGVGILVAGSLSSLVGWRLALGFLGLPAFVLAFALWRYLPEPVRGGQAHLSVGDDSIVTADDVAPAEPDEDGRGRLDDPSLVVQQAAAQGADPDPATVLDGPAELNLWGAVRFVLRVRTNVALIVASGLGYFFFAGLETFAELFFRLRYGVGQAVASVLFILVAAGAVLGVLLSGRLADHLIRKGHTAARLTVAAAAYLVTVVVFIPGTLSTTLVISVPILLVAAAALGGTNPPVDAARLDVMPAHLWGRAEAVRTALAQVLQGLAPLVFGLTSAAFGAPSAGLGAGVDSASTPASAAASHGLELAFIVLALPLLLSGGALLVGRAGYLRDVVAARRSDERRAGVVAA